MDTQEGQPGDTGPLPTVDSPDFRIGFADGVITVELTRPHKRNALSLEVIRALVAALEPIADSEEAKVLVIKGDEQAFCAGADLSAEDSGPMEAGRGPWREVIDKEAFATAFRRFEALPVIKIAQIEGPCMGGGVVLATVCEFRFASEDAIFGIPELDIGFPFVMGGLPRLVRYIGLTRAVDMVLTCRRMGAPEALACGLLTQVTTAEELEGTVSECAERLSRHSKYLVVGVTRQFREAGDDLVDASHNDIPLTVLAAYDAESQRAATVYLDALFRRQGS